MAQVLIHNTIDTQVILGGTQIHHGMLTFSLVVGSGDSKCYSCNINTAPAAAPYQWQRLVDQVAPSALYDAAQVQDAARCHPGTRKAILRRFEDRVSSSAVKKPLTWLHGSAGAGKSAIMRTLCERLAAKNQLLASFFFFRTDA